MRRFLVSRRLLVILALVLVGGLWLAPVAFAADGTPTFDLKALLTALIPLLVPILIAGGKAVIPALPRRALPFLAAGLGAALELLGYYGGLTGGSVLLGAILGAAGTGVREMYDQTKQVLRA